MRRLLPLIICYLVVATAEARIGETSYQFAIRYGHPSDTVADKSPSASSVLLEGAIHHTYEYQGWKIRAAFLQINGPAVRIDFSKLPNGQDLPIRIAELEAIKMVNTPLGMTWKEIAPNNSNLPNNLTNTTDEVELANLSRGRTWLRADGVILSLPSPLVVRLELPAARQHEEKLRIQREQKAIASIPKAIAVTGPAGDTKSQKSKQALTNKPKEQHSSLVQLDQASNTDHHSRFGVLGWAAGIIALFVIYRRSAIRRRRFFP